MGIVWKFDIETDDKQEVAYGYTHNSAFVMLMAAAKAYITYGEYHELGYENCTHEYSGAAKPPGMRITQHMEPFVQKE